MKKYSLTSHSKPRTLGHMNTARPPKEIDLPTILFTQPGFQPTYGRTSFLEQVRTGYHQGELTARLQRSGLFLVRALMLGAEFSEDPQAQTFARHIAATLMIGSSWHSYAEVRPGDAQFPPRSVRRRRLMLPDHTWMPKENRPSEQQLHSTATEQLADCILQANRSINASRSAEPDGRIETNTRTGHVLGASALQIVGADVGRAWTTRPSMSAHEAQEHLMYRGQALIAGAVALSNQIKAVGSLAMLADPRPNPLQEYVWDTMPRSLTDRYDAMQRSLIAA